MSRLQKIALVCILVLGSALRLYRLGSYPPLNADEAAIGYNTWSLLETGKDEHGEAWPIHFKSFGDYKPGAYFYMVMPFTAIFGPNEWAVRLPSALSGIATIFLVFLLAESIWKDKNLGLLWAFVLSVSPWHIHFSRGGWESNVAVFLITLGVYLFFSSFKEKNRKFSISSPRETNLFIFNFESSRNKLVYFQLSIIFFVLSLYTYHSARVVAPFLFLGLAAFKAKTLWERRKILLLPIIIGVILTVPLIFSFLKGGASSRFSGVGLFADSGPLWRANELRSQHEDPNGLVSKVLHNRYILYTISFAQKYFSHFDGNFLFIDGDNVPRSKLPEMGQMYWFEFILLAMGIAFWLRTHQKEKHLPFLWLLVGPLASALTFQAPSALRSLSMTIPLSFFSASGTLALIRKPTSGLSKKLIITGLTVAYLWGIFSWSNQYFNHYLKRFPSAWPGGFKEVVLWLKENGNSFERVVVTNKYDQPYILFLYYLRYPPSLTQQEIRLTPPDQYGFSTVRTFGKYCFGLNECDLQKVSARALVIAAPDEAVDGRMIKEIYGVSGNLTFKLYEHEP